ncbi:Acetyl-coenzyme A synthetase [hydrothermal vent metagenome]|uniref:Acetyl-coenzyme A synthetase n=1 Tax=hydrothermal vent metagenome TaxID=652676 RepID=A0A3B1D475_9ZZZZ
MKISGFTIARNAVKFNYPILESIHSILPICDEFIVNVGDSKDDTLGLIQSIKSDKIRIIQNTWDMTMGKEVLSYQTNLALKECSGDWAFYLQTDEVIHEDDLPKLKHLMQQYVTDETIDALRFKWLHFYGSYHRYRIDSGWYQKQDRIVRNNGQVESFGDAFGFQRKDGKSINRKNTQCLLYHYGWVQPQEVMAQRRVNAEKIGFVQLKDNERQEQYTYGDLSRFHPYFGSHPKVMSKKVSDHAMSQQDQKAKKQQYWYHPGQWFNWRYKTGKRVKVKI